MTKLKNVKKAVKGLWFAGNKQEALRILTMHNLHGWANPRSIGVMKQCPLSNKM